MRLAASMPPVPAAHLPAAPVFEGPKTDVHKRALELVWQGARSREGMTLMATTACTTFTQRLNFVALPLLAPLMVTPAARLALVGSALAVELFSVPLAYAAQSLSINRFVTRFMLDDQQRLSQQLGGQARLWKNGAVEAGARQQIIKGGSELGLSVAGFLADAARVGVNLGVGAWGLSAVAGASPVLLAVAVGSTLLPLVLRTLANGVLTRAEARVVDRDQQLQSHIQRFWDNTVIGIAEARKRWSDRYAERLADARSARWLSQQILTGCGELERLPEAVVQRLSTFSYLHERYFGQPAQLISFDTLTVLQGTQAALAGLGNAVSLVTGLQRIGRRLTVRNRLQHSIAASPDLITKVKPQQIELVHEGKLLDTEKVLQRLDELAAVGLTTVRAPNGSGKTAFLSMCRQHFGRDALFLPAAHTIDFGVPQGSTGESVMYNFGFIDSQAVLPKVILLDEWNANLDADNTARGVAMIDRWRKTASVVEVKNKD